MSLLGYSLLLLSPCHGPCILSLAALTNAASFFVGPDGQTQAGRKFEIPIDWAILFSKTFRILDALGLD